MITQFHEEALARTATRRIFPVIPSTEAREVNNCALPEKFDLRREFTGRDAPHRSAGEAPTGPRRYFRRTPAAAQSGPYDDTRGAAPLLRPHPRLARRRGGHVLVVRGRVRMGPGRALPARLRLRGAERRPSGRGRRSRPGRLATPHPRGRLLSGPDLPRDPGDLAGPTGGARLERSGEPEVASLPGPDDRAGRSGLLQPGDPALLPLAAAGRPVPRPLGRRHVQGPGALPVLRRPRRSGGNGRKRPGHQVVDPDVPLAAVDGPRATARRPHLPLPGPQARFVHGGTRADPGLHRGAPPGVRPRTRELDRAERDQLDVLPQAQPTGVAARRAAPRSSARPPAEPGLLPSERGGAGSRTTWAGVAYGGFPRTRSRPAVSRAFTGPVSQDRPSQGRHHGTSLRSLFGEPVPTPVRTPDAAPFTSAEATVAGRLPGGSSGRPPPPRRRGA